LSREPQASARLRPAAQRAPIIRPHKGITMTFRVFLGFALAAWCSSGRGDEQRQGGPEVRWVTTESIDVELVGMKKEMALDADAAAKLFTKDFPHLRDGWEKLLPGKPENAPGARDVPDSVKKAWIEAKEGEKPYASVLQFSDKELIVVVRRPRGRYLWHIYYECLARLRLPRGKDVDDIFEVARLEKTYGAQLKGLRQGSSLAEVKKALGEPDGRIGYQAAGLEKLVYFKDDVVITMTIGRVERFDFGVPDSLKDEIKRKGPNLLRY
jgi:hypothetical protein